MFNSDAKVTVGNSRSAVWCQRLDTATDEEGIYLLDGAAPVIIFRQRTGQCQLLSRPHRLKISDSDECPWSKVPQISIHVFQSRPMFDALILGLGNNIDM